MTTPESVRLFLQYQAYEAVFLSRTRQAGIEDVADLHEYAANHLGTRALISYLEFGVANGDSLRRIVDRLLNPETRLIGFDSFYGLPEDWSVGAVEQRIIPKGTFSRRGQLPAFSDPRVSFVVGWFQNTVPNFLLSSAGGLAGRKILVHFDADLYSSTLFLLSSLWPFLHEYYFIMDDFFQDDMIALYDFVRSYPVQLDWLACRRNAAGLPTKAFGKMRRIGLEIDPTQGLTEGVKAA